MVMVNTNTNERPYITTHQDEACGHTILLHREVMWGQDKILPVVFELA
jgi:hypothetical protein